MDSFRKEIQKGRKDLDSEVKSRLNQYIVNIRQKIERSFNNFDGLLQYEEKQLAKLDGYYNKIKEDLSALENQLSAYQLA